MTTLDITRLLDAPRELVFEVWTNPDHLAKWWGPTGFTAVSCTVNLTEGGAWRVCIRDGDTEHWASGVYHEIRRPDRLVFSFAWEEPVGSPGHDTLVTVEFADRDGKTEMFFHQEVFETVESRDSHHEGWQETFNDLTDYLTEVKPMTAALEQGDLGLLDTDIAQRRLHSHAPLRLAYTALDGTPRVIPVLFHWNGEEVVMAGFAPSARSRALRVNPAVALTIDTDEQPPEVLLIRGRAEVTEMRGVVPEYARYMGHHMPEVQAAAYFAEIERRGTVMERIAVRPTWVGVMDFQTRYPTAMPDWMRS